MRHPRIFQAAQRPAGAPRGMVARIAVATFGVALIAALMVVLFPDLSQGPLGRVDPLYAQVRLDKIVEIQPLIQAHWLAAGLYGAVIGRVISVLGIAVVAVPLLVLLLIRSRGARRNFWVMVAIALLVYLPLAFHEVRWATYTEALLIWPYAAGAAWLVARLSTVLSIAAPWWRPPILVVALLWPSAVSAGLPQRETNTAGGACALDRVAPILQRDSAEPRTILAYADYGSELLYRTRHRVLSIPNHRFQPGFTATYRILTATDDETAQTLLARFGVDWILLCPSQTERTIFALQGRSAPTLYQRLVAGKVPGWLRALPLDPDIAAAARLFEVKARSNPIAAPADN